MHLVSLDLNRIGMSGHSFGACTIPATSGEIVRWLSEPMRDPRIEAAMPLSVSMTNLDTVAQLLGSVAIPLPNGWECFQRFPRQPCIPGSSNKTSVSRNPKNKTPPARGFVLL